MKLGSILSLIQGPDLIQIREGDKDIYTGYLGMLKYDSRQEELMRMKVTGIRMRTDVAARDWKTKKVLAPIFPDDTADYKFQNVELRLFLRIDVES